MMEDPCEAVVSMHVEMKHMQTLEEMWLPRFITICEIIFKDVESTSSWMFTIGDD